MYQVGEIIMDWIQTLTIITSIFGAVFYIQHQHKEDIQRHDIELRDVRTLWSTLLEKIYGIEKQILAIKKEPHPKL